MQISESTLDVLRNFSDINGSILITPGDTLVSFSNGGTVLANAKIEDTFTERFGIYDLVSFLALTSLIEDPQIDTSNADTHIVISGGGSKFKFYVADESIINVPKKTEVELPSKEITFSLSEDSLKQVLKAAAVLQMENVTIFSKDGELHFGVSDPKVKSSDSFSVKIDDYEGEEVNLIISISKLTLMAGTYRVDISTSTSRIMIQFTNLDRDLRYWTAPEADSTVGS